MGGHFGNCPLFLLVVELCYPLLTKVSYVLFVLDKKIVPKGANDLKLINAGKVLENNKTVGQCRVPFGELPRGVITMHAVVQPSLAKAKTGSFFFTYACFTSSWVCDTPCYYLNPKLGCSNPNLLIVRSEC